MQVGAQMRRTTVIPHSKPILNTSKLKIEIDKIEIEIDVKWYIFGVFKSCGKLKH